MALQLKLVDLPFGLFLDQPKLLLKQALKLIAATTHRFQFIIRQFTPLLANLTFHLFPIAGDLIPVHHSTSFEREHWSRFASPCNMNCMAGKSGTESGHI